MSKWQVYLKRVVGLFLLIVLVSCGQRGQQQVAKASAGGLDGLREKIHLTPLVEKWYYHLDNETIRQIMVSEDQLLVETESKKLFALERSSGIPKWVYYLQHPVDYAPSVDKDRMYLLSMGYLHVLDKKTGLLLHKKELHFAPCSGPCAANKSVYLGGWNGFLYALDNQTGYQNWRFPLDGQMLSAPIETDGKIFFGSTDERIYSIYSTNGTSNSGWAQNGRYPTRAANITTVALQENPPTLYIGSRDTNLYALDRNSGRMLWKFESGGEIIKDPVSIGETVYVVSERLQAPGSVLFLVETTTGDAKWHLDKGSMLFFRGNRYSWILCHDNEAVAVNRDTGAVQGTYNLYDFDLFACNRLDNQGYLATQDGWIFGVAEE